MPTDDDDDESSLRVGTHRDEVIIIVPARDVRIRLSADMATELAGMLVRAATKAENAVSRPDRSRMS